MRSMTSRPVRGPASVPAFGSALVLALGPVSVLTLGLASVPALGSAPVRALGPLSALPSGRGVPFTRSFDVGHAFPFSSMTTDQGLYGSPAPTNGLKGS